MHECDEFHHAQEERSIETVIAMEKTTLSGPLPGQAAAVGPLVVSAANPHYFTIRSDKTGLNNDAEHHIVYLTGSHIWNNFHDGMGPGSTCVQTPEALDYSADLAFLKNHGHNRMKLWRWEQFKSQAAGGSYHLCMTPQPWSRTGTGLEMGSGKHPLI
jgi:hypothetical protein